MRCATGLVYMYIHITQDTLGLWHTTNSQPASHPPQRGHHQGWGAGTDTHHPPGRRQRSAWVSVRASSPVLSPLFVTRIKSVFVFPQRHSARPKMCFGAAGQTGRHDRFVMRMMWVMSEAEWAVEGWGWRELMGCGEGGHISVWQVSIRLHARRMWRPGREPQGVSLAQHRTWTASVVKAHNVYGASHKILIPILLDQC